MNTSTTAQFGCQSSLVSASAQIEKHLWDAIDLMAATLEKPDPRVWATLDIYRPRDHAQCRQEPATTLDTEHMHQMIYRRVYNAVQHILGEQHLTGTIWLATQQAAEDIASSISLTDRGGKQ